MIKVVKTKEQMDEFLYTYGYEDRTNVSFMGGNFPYIIFLSNHRIKYPEKDFYGVCIPLSYIFQDLTEEEVYNLKPNIFKLVSEKVFEKLSNLVSSEGGPSTYL